MTAPRLVIAGGPRTGKTTLAQQLQDSTPEYAARPSLLSTDDAIGMGWSEASEWVSRWIDRPGPWIVEGVAAPRALRKWLARNPTGKPCDAVLWLATTLEPTSDGQRRMADGCRTVMSGIMHDLGCRGVRVVNATHPQRYVDDARGLLR